MTVDEVRDYIRQGWKYQAEYDSLKLCLDTLSRQRIWMSQCSKKVNDTGKKSVSDIQFLDNEIMVLQRKISVADEHVMRISNMIDCISDPTVKDAITLFCINGFPVDVIADKICYSVRQTWRLLDRGYNEIAFKYCESE